MDAIHFQANPRTEAEAEAITAARSWRKSRGPGTSGSPSHTEVDKQYPPSWRANPAGSELRGRWLRRLEELEVIPSPERVALLIIDVQHDFVHGSMAIDDASAIVPVINRLQETVSFDEVVVATDWHPPTHCSFRSAVAQHTRHHSSPPLDADARRPEVVFTAPDGKSPMPQRLFPDHCVQGSAGAELAAGLRPRDGHLLVRKGTEAGVDSYSAFFDNLRLRSTGLEDDLAARGINTVLVCGLALEGCVAATARHAAELGLDTFVVHDASRAGGGEEAARNALEELEKEHGVRAMSAAEAAERWAATAGVPAEAQLSGPRL